jgi:hypothetical protein
MICRSATFDSKQLVCYLTDLTVDTGPEWITKNVDSFEYNENHCLNGNDMGPMLGSLFSVIFAIFRLKNWCFSETQFFYNFFCLNM